ILSESICLNDSKIVEEVKQQDILCIIGNRIKSEHADILYMRMLASFCMKWKEINGSSNSKCRGMPLSVYMKEKLLTNDIKNIFIKKNIPLNIDMNENSQKNNPENSRMDDQEHVTIINNFLDDIKKSSETLNKNIDDLNPLYPEIGFDFIEVLK
ncbi:MAG: hypothetical protein MHPSP_001429, partial [Paramarteilia canceri]